MIADFNRVFPVDHPEAEGPESHLLKTQEVLAMHDAVNLSGREWNHIDFRGEAFLDLLAQEGARGLRIFPVFNGHHASVGVVALDEHGLPLGPDTLALENGQRCPPFC